MRLGGRHQVHSCKYGKNGHQGVNQLRAANWSDHTNLGSRLHSSSFALFPAERTSMNLHAVLCWSVVADQHRLVVNQPDKLKYSKKAWWRTDIPASHAWDQHPEHSICKSSSFEIFSLSLSLCLAFLSLFYLCSESQGPLCSLLPTNRAEEIPVEVHCT